MIADNQVKIIASDFCEFHKSCDDCLKANKKRRHMLNEECFWENKCTSKPENVDQNESRECKHSFNGSYNRTKIQNTALSQIQKINQNISVTTTEIVPEHIGINLVIYTIITICLVLILIVLIIFKKIGIQSLKNILILRYEKKKSSKKKIEDNLKQNDYFEDIYSVKENTKKRAQNVYQNNKIATKTGLEKQINKNFFQSNSCSSDLILDFYAITIPHSKSELQQKNNKDCKQPPAHSKYKKNDSISNYERRNFAIVTENEEIYYENK